MQIVRVRFRTNREFLDAYVKDLPNGGLFCPTTTVLRSGTPVICELSVPALPNKVLIRGIVRAWRPALPRLRVRAGATVEFDADEQVKRDFVLETIKGQRAPTPRRRHTRLPVALPIRWRAVGMPESAAGDLTEISVGGALLKIPEQVPLGTELVVEITPPGAVSPLGISGTVTYHGPGDSTGVRFHYRDGGGSRRLRELVRRLRVA